MKPAFVVDLLDEAGKMFDNVLECFEGHRIDRFDLQRFHEALGFCVVVRIASATHRADQTLGVKKLSVEFGRILRAAIGMMDAAGRWLSAVDGSSQGRD